MKLGIDLFIKNASCLHDVSQIRKIHVNWSIQIFESERKGDRERERERKERERRESLVGLK